MDYLDPRLEAIIQQILKRKLPLPPPPTDPLAGMDRPPQAPPAVLPLSEPWRVAVGNRMKLSLPAPRGAEFGVYADVDWPPKFRGAGINYKQEF